MQVREKDRKGRKVAKHCVFPMICGSGGSKSRLAKGAEPSGQMRGEKLHAIVAQSPFQSQNVQSLSFGAILEVEMSKKWTPLWCDAHLQVKKLGALLEVETSKKCTPLWCEARVEIKMYQKKNGSDHFWKLRCRKSARRCGAKHVSKSKCTKKRPGWTTFGSWDVEKMHAVVVRSTCRSQNVQNTSASEHFWKLRCSKSVRCCGAKHISKSKCTKHYMFAPLSDVEASFCVAGARDFPPGQKWAKCEGFVAFPKTMAGVGHLKRICKDAFRVAGAVQERDVRRLGRWFPEKGCISEHQICRFDEMILPDRCSTSYDLASIFRGRRSTLDSVEWKNRKMHWYEAVNSALNFPFLNEVSQNSFVFKLADR